MSSSFTLVSSERVSTVRHEVDVDICAMRASAVDSVLRSSTVA
jgi:hypothetical protein